MLVFAADEILSLVHPIFLPSRHFEVLKLVFRV